MIALLRILPLVLIGPAVAVAGGLAPTQEPATADEVKARQAAAATAYAKPGIAKAEPRQEQEEGKPPVSLQGRALALTDGDRWTMLPRRAVVGIPQDVPPSSRLREGRDGKLVDWATFYAANRGSLKSFAVNPGHLNGSAGIPDRTYESWKQSRVLVVTTYLNNPVSLPYTLHPATRKPDDAS